MAQSLFVFARIHPKPEHLTDARQAILGILSPTRAEEGCLSFDLFDGQDDGCLYLFEEWVNQAALDNHYAQDYTAKVFRAYEEWLAEPVTVTKMGKATAG